MKKSFIALSLMVTLGVGGIVGEVTPVKAAGYSQSDIESRLRAANSQISNLQNQLGTAQQQYDRLN